MAKRKINGKKKVVFRGLQYIPGNDFADINNHNTSYGDDNKKRIIIKQLRDKGIEKIRTFRKGGKPVFVNLEKFFKIAA